MIHTACAATEAKLSADLMPLEGVESCLVRHMARAHALAEACFARAEQTGAEVAEAPIRRDADLRLGVRLATLFARALAAFNHHRAQIREELKTALKQDQRTQFDQVLHLAALADAAVAQKAKGGAPAEEDAEPAPAAPSTDDAEAPPLNRHQRRAASRRQRKAGGVAQGP